MPRLSVKVTTTYGLFVEERSSQPKETLSLPTLDVRFMSVGSGSSGNCYYLASPEGSVLIDLGVSLYQLKSALEKEALGLESIKAVFLTHGHCDHTRNVARFSVLYNIPIVATSETFSHLDSLKSRFKIAKRNRIVVDSNATIRIAGFEVMPFAIPHDFPNTVGYRFACGTFSLALLSDVGHYLPEHYRIARSSNHLILESNFDRQMLLTGKYPYSLKLRIAGPRGHTGNKEAALFLNQVFHADMQRVWLCHLSQDNNTPSRCLETFMETLAHRKEELSGVLEVLPRFTPSPPYRYPLLEVEKSLEL